MSKTRLTQEQAAACDLFAHSDHSLTSAMSVFPRMAAPMLLLGNRILDLLDERTALVEQLAQAKAALDSSQAGLGGVCIALGLHHAAQARDDRGLLASAPIFDFCTALVARAEQAEADRDALASALRNAVKVLHIAKIGAILGTDAAQALSRSKEKP